jgi:hypothetical protein
LFDLHDAARFHKRLGSRLRAVIADQPYVLLFAHHFGKLHIHRLIQSPQPILGFTLRTKAIADDLFRMPVQNDGQIHPGKIKENLSLGGLIGAYLEYCESYYKNSNEPRNIENALVVFLGKNGTLKAEDFDQNHFKIVRNLMIEKGLARKTINDYCSAMRRMFRWAAEEQMVPSIVWHNLQVVRNLKFGRTNAKEGKTTSAGGGRTC